jgi:hypothetical protein
MSGEEGGAGEHTAGEASRTGNLLAAVARLRREAGRAPPPAHQAAHGHRRRPATAPCRARNCSRGRAGFSGERSDKG